MTLRLSQVDAELGNPQNFFLVSQMIGNVIQLRVFQISSSSNFLFWNFDWFFELQGGIPIRITNLGLCLCPNLEALVKAKLLVLKLNLGKWVGMLLDTDTLRSTLRYVVLNRMLHMSLMFWKLISVPSWRVNNQVSHSFQNRRLIFKVFVQSLNFLIILASVPYNLRKGKMGYLSQPDWFPWLIVSLESK